MSQEIERDNYCFCCGRENRQGLHLSFSYPDEETAETELTIPEHFTGWKNVVHGGLLAMLLDETMAHACISAKRYAVTAEMTVRYRKPAEVGHHIKVTGRVSGTRRQIVMTEGHIHDDRGDVVATATARYLARAKGVAP